MIAALLQMNHAPTGSLILARRVGCELPRRISACGGCGRIVNVNMGATVVWLARVLSFAAAFGLAAAFSVACTPAGSESSSAVPAPAPTDVTFVIPAGTESSLERGEPGFHFPDEIQLRAGQSVVITNQDYAMHYFFDIPVAPGETIRKSFSRPGEFVYQGGLSCSISRTNSIKVRVE